MVIVTKLVLIEPVVYRVWRITERKAVGMLGQGCCEFTTPDIYFQKSMVFLIEIEYLL